MGSHQQMPQKATNLSQLLHGAAESPQEKGIQIHRTGDLSDVTTISYRTLFDVASQNSAFLDAIPSARRDTIFLLHFDNHADGIVWFWSVVLAGYTPALSPPFSNNPDQHRKHLAHLKTLLREPIVLTTSKFAPYFTVDNTMQPERVHAVDSHAPANSAHARPIGLDSPASPAALMLTSGSTGNAKAVSLSHAQLLSAMAGKVTCHQTTPDDVFLNWIGLDHVANLAESHLHAVYLNAPQVHVHAEDLISSPRAFLELIAQHRVSFSFAPNFFLASLARELSRNPLSAGLGLSSLRCVTSGGEALGVETALSLLGHLEAFGCPSSVLVPGFGMTETCAGSIHNNRFPEDSKGPFAALGTCHDGIEMRVMGVDGVVAAGETGQLHLRGPLVFSEYYNDPVSTKNAFIDDWFVTGDLAVIEEGMLRLVGREKDQVNINGVKYDLGELQTALDMANIPGTSPSYTVVFGHRPDGNDTEVVSVVYLPSDQDDKLIVEANDAIAGAVLLHCSARPHKIIPLDRHDLQKTTLGKLSASKVRQMFESGQFAAQDAHNQARLAAYLAMTGESDSPTERAIQQALSDALDVPLTDTSPNSSLLHMGVNSMQLIRFKKRVQDLVGIADIPMVTILTNPTVRGLASTLGGVKLASSDLEQVQVAYNRDSSDVGYPPSVSYNPVITLNPTGPLPPLWLVHPGAGEILVYLNLAKHFHAERPIHALRARGFDDEPFFSSIPECISTYVASIRRVQPKGPYNILGYSFGSMFAFEIAKALRSDGQDISFLGVLNLPPHIKQRIRQLNMVTAVLTLSLFLGLVTDDDPDTFFPGGIQDQTHDDILDEILERRAPPGRMVELALDRAKLLRWAEVSNALHAMAWDYEPSGMVEHVDVFVAHPLRQVARNREEWFAEQVSKWAYFSRTLPRFHEAEGEHFSMIGVQHVGSFAAKLKTALEGRGL